MINKDELLFTVDKQNHTIDPQPRKVVHKNAIWHRTCQIWIKNSKSQILCQKRSLLKDMAPGKWESFFGGHLPPNESYTNHAFTELAEELGLKIDKGDLKQILVYKESRAFEFQAIFILKWDGEPKTLKPEPDEIDQIKWVSKNTVRKNIEKDSWTNPGYANQIFNLI